jgi:hypothetical protein
MTTESTLMGAPPLCSEDAAEPGTIVAGDALEGDFVAADDTI